MKTPSKKLCAITFTMKVNLWNGKIAASFKMEKSQTQVRKVHPKWRKVKHRGEKFTQNGEKSNTGEKSSLKLKKEKQREESQPKAASVSVYHLNNGQSGKWRLER